MVQKQKNAPEELIKTVIDPDPGPSLIHYKMEKGVKVSVSGLLYTLAEDIKAEPITRFL